MKAIQSSGIKLFDKLSQPILDFVNPFSSIIDKIRNQLKVVEQLEKEKEMELLKEYLTIWGNPFEQFNAA